MDAQFTFLQIMYRFSFPPLSQLYTHNIYLSHLKTQSFSFLGSTTSPMSRSDIPGLWSACHKVYGKLIHVNLWGGWQQLFLTMAAWRFPQKVLGKSPVVSRVQSGTPNTTIHITPTKTAGTL